MTKQVKKPVKDLFEIEATLGALHANLFSVLVSRKSEIRRHLRHAVDYVIELRAQWHEFTAKEQESFKDLFDELVLTIHDAEKILGETVLPEQKTSSPPLATTPPSKECLDFIARLTKDYKDGHPGINFHDSTQNTQIKAEIQRIIDYLIKNQHEIANLPPEGKHFSRAITGSGFSAQVLKENGEYVLAISLKTHVTSWSAKGGFKKVKEALLFGPKGWTLSVDAVSKVGKKESITEMKRESDIANDIDSVNIHKPLIGPVYQGKTDNKDEKKRTYNQPKQSLFSPKKQSMEELIKNMQEAGEKLSIENLFLIMHTLTEGYTALHKKYIHRDGKPGNYLIFRDTEGNLFGSISDFGLAIREQDKDKTSHLAGTHGYIAPEKLKYLLSTKSEKSKPEFLHKNKHGFEILTFLETQAPVVPVKFPSAIEDVYSLGLSFQKLFEASKLAEDKSLPTDTQEIIQKLILLIKNMTVSAQDRMTSEQVLAQLNALLEEMLTKKMPCATAIHAKLANHYQNKDFMEKSRDVPKPVEMSKDEVKAIPSAPIAHPAPASPPQQNITIFYVVIHLGGRDSSPQTIWQAIEFSKNCAGQGILPIPDKFELYADLASAEAKMNPTTGAIVAFQGSPNPENFKKENMLWVQRANNSEKIDLKSLLADEKAVEKAAADLKNDFSYKINILKEIQKDINTHEFDVNFSRHKIAGKQVTKTAKEINDLIITTMQKAQKQGTTTQTLELLAKTLAHIQDRASKSLDITAKDGKSKLSNIGLRTSKSAFFHGNIMEKAKTALHPLGTTALSVTLNSQNSQTAEALLHT